MATRGFTVRAMLKTKKPNKAGGCPVVICVTVKGNKSLHSAGVVVTEKEWDVTKLQVKANVANANVYNIRITNLIQKLTKELDEAVDRGDVSVETVRTTKRAATCFYKYCEGIFGEMERKGVVESTIRRYRSNIPSIKEYAGDNLNIGDIDKSWLRGYEEFCRGAKNSRMKKSVRAYSQNTICSRFKMLRKMLLQAAEEEIIPACPLGKGRGGYAMPAWEDVMKDYLTMDEVDRLLAVLGSAAFSDHEDMVLSYFLIECTAGIRHSDWSRFKIEKLVDGIALSVVTKKTGEPIYIPVTPGSRLSRVLEHIEVRGYKYTLTESAAANKVLKVITKMVHIGKPVTTHTGRHTAATLFLEMGFTRESVAEILGVTMRVVDTYAKMTRQKVRMEFDRLGGI